MILDTVEDDRRGTRVMSAARSDRPEPNFARLITKDELNSIAISAHALRRFMQPPAARHPRRRPRRRSNGKTRMASARATAPAPSRDS
jgi:hypothetical protein